MVQCCHGWLLAQFLSPAWNTRTDEYGGPIENRVKFPLQVLKAVREKIGNDMVIEIRISGDEHQKNGWTIEDMIRFSHMVEGIADFIAIGRGALADSDMPRKILQGKEEDIRPCIRCVDCMGRIYGGFYACNVNPTAGQEAYLLNTPPAEEKKKVLVVGGGPGGMQAAITAADRGHEVILAEQKDRLGGALLFTDIDVHKKDLKRFKDYLVRQVSKRKIDVRLNATADIGFLEELQPEAIIVAAGATPRVLSATGSELAYHATAAYYQPERVGRKVVLIGGGLIGCEVALHMAEFGKDITILELTDQLARDANMFHRPTMLELMEEKKEQIHSVLNASTTAVQKDGVVYEDAKREEHFIEADTVLYAVGSVANTSVVEELRAWDGWEIFQSIGDCTGSGIVRKAVHGGYYAALYI